MTKEDRWAIIEKWSGIEHPTVKQVQCFIDRCVTDELMYAGLKAWANKLDINEEFNKVLRAHSFEGYQPSNQVLGYIRHYSMCSQLAAMQHVDLNGCAFYIGEYYDGTPTSKYRKKGRYEIEPIKL